MSALSEIFETVFGAQLGCYDAESVTIGTASYACASAETIHAQDLADGGFYERNGVTLAVRRSLFTALPSLNSTATYDSKTWLIDRIRQSHDRAVVLLDLLPSHT